ncbi:MAG TPA: hypothetical protein PKK06_09170 [Phycisphaerae bacterium]|nr:hypothetical protein [Phycisphaerae bacterium]HNU45410.1 hypothetical protein [Phycisphaerae bacterium]
MNSSPDTQVAADGSAPAGAEQRHPAVPHDEDLYCIHCGYNLRGLFGDPIRCPECGGESAVRDLRVPARVIAVQLRKLEGCPVNCVTAMFLFVPALAMAWVAWPPGLVCVGGVVAWWWVGARHCASICSPQSNWTGMLFWFHVAGLLWGALVIVLVTGPVLTPDPAIGGYLSLIALGLLAAAGVMGLARRWLGINARGPYTIAKAKLAELARGTAVRLAEQELARRGAPAPAVSVQTR